MKSSYDTAMSMSNRSWTLSTWCASLQGEISLMSATIVHSVVCVDVAYVVCEHFTKPCSSPDHTLQM